jgi:hypothetical protein
MSLSAEIRGLDNPHTSLGLLLDPAEETRNLETKLMGKSGQLPLRIIDKPITPTATGLVKAKGIKAVISGLILRLLTKKRH